MKHEIKIKEMEVLQTFLLEFSPIYTEQEVFSMGYKELIKAVKETAKLL